MSDPLLTVTRQQLAQFLKDPRTIRAFEKALVNANTILPGDVVTLTRLFEESSTDAARAQQSANEALDALSRLAGLLELVVLSSNSTIPQDDLGMAPPAISADVIEALSHLAELSARMPAFRFPKMGEVADVIENLPAAGHVLIYDATTKNWKSAAITQGTGVTVTNADGSITIAATGEPAITAGTTAQYWRGDKTWQDLFTQVRSATLTGLSTATNAVITAADTVLSALGKLQKQVSDNLTTLTTHTGASSAHGTTGAVVGTSDSQTLTNKTLTNPTINGFTGDTSIVNIGSGQLYKSVAGNVGINNGNPDAIGGRLVIGNFSATGATSEQIYMATNKAIFTIAPDGATNAAGVTLGVGWANGGQGPLKVAIGATTPLVADTASTRPGVDNTYSCGSASFRWSVIYSATALINTSDARDKTPVRQLYERELDAAKELAAELGIYQFLTAVAEKGGSARLHTGMTVQRAMEIMRKHGLDPMSYAFICHDTWEAEVIVHEPVAASEASPAEYETRRDEEQVIVDGELTTIVKEYLVEVKPKIEAREAKDGWTEIVREAGDKYGFRTDELLMFIARGFEARLTELETLLKGEAK